MSLWSVFLNNRGRIIHKWTHYFPAYERHFSQFMGRNCTFIEIGCGEGGSLQMWKQYLGPLATIVGIDIRPECAAFEEDQIHIRIGDQADPGFLRSIVEEFGVPDVVLDDGSHVMSHIKASFDALYPLMGPRSVYFVEDLHTAYWEEYEGGLGCDSSFIEHCKRMIDELNAVHTRGAVPETVFSRTTISMHVYDSIVVFEKGAYGRKHAPMTGAAITTR
jgi:hypothetical protein